jgi:hypothetical protein
MISCTPRATVLNALLLPIVATSSLALAAPPISANWALEGIWDDGLAEVAVYEASRVIYGAPRPYEAVLLTVKEDFDSGKLVKADPPYGNRPIVTVLKQNAVREIATPNYDYRIMTSTFVERADPMRLAKLTSGSHEWCGNTWKAVRNFSGRVTYEWASYFDGEADGRQELEIRPGDLLEDQLPLTLRGMKFEPGVEFEARLLPSMANTHAGPARWRKATVRMEGRETLEIPLGRLMAWRVKVTTPDYATTLWFDVSAPHALVQLETTKGDQMKLKSIERRAYWVLP